jgi:hypothetical protein
LPQGANCRPRSASLFTLGPTVLTRAAPASGRCGVGAGSLGKVRSHSPTAPIGIAAPASSGTRIADPPTTATHRRAAGKRSVFREKGAFPTRRCVLQWPARPPV